jgi:hypothetical protein
MAARLVRVVLQLLRRKEFNNVALPISASASPCDYCGVQPAMLSCNVIGDVWLRC